MAAYDPGQWRGPTPSVCRCGLSSHGAREGGCPGPRSPSEAIEPAAAEARPGAVGGFRMPENRQFKRLARKTAAERGEPYAAAAERLRGEPAYIPGFGFRPALAGFQSAAAVSAQGPAGVAVVTHVLGSADRTEVDIELQTDREFEFDAAMRGPVVRAELSARGWTATGGGLFSCGRQHVQLRITFPPVPHRVRSVTLRLSGDLGHWQLRVPVKPLGGVARRSEATAGGAATRHGVALEVSGAVFDWDRTVVRITAAAHEPIRFVRGLGTELGSRRPPGQELVLVDELGNTYREETSDLARPDPAGREHTVVFPPGHPAASSFRLEVPFVGAEESGGGVEADVPIKPQTVRIGRYRLELQTSEPTTGTSARFYPLRIRYRWLAPPASRRPLGPGQVLVNGRGVAFGHPWPSQGDFVDVQVPDPPARRVRLAFPRVQL